MQRCSGIVLIDVVLLNKRRYSTFVGKVKLQISKAIENFGEQALRVLGFAYKIVANPRINEQV